MRPHTGFDNSPLESFWMGGFEGADHVNGRGEALDMACASGHWARLDEDYRRAAKAGLRTLRESIGWRLCERPGGHIDLSRVERIAHIANRHGLQILWTVMHYGLPGDLSLHDDAFIGRFSRFASEVARLLKPLSPRAPVFTPVNEISFLAWMAAQPHLLAPPNHSPADQPEQAFLNGYLVKRRLVQAALAAVQAMRDVDDRARFLHVEPLCHAVPPTDRPDLADHAQTVRSWQWQAWDMLAGLSEPALGGSPKALDLIGVNHYHASQWEVGTGTPLAWHLRDRRRKPLGDLLEETWLRYQRPLLIAETGHVGAGRADWLHEVAGEVRRVRGQRGVPVLGVGLYPLVDRPDWNEPQSWHKSGLWHVDASTVHRTAVPEYLHALRAWRRALPDPVSPVREELRPVILAKLEQPLERLPPDLTAALVRMAQSQRVVAVEPAHPQRGAPWLDCFERGAQLDILAPHGEADEAAEMVRLWLAGQGINAYTIWAGVDQHLSPPTPLLFPAQVTRGWSAEEAHRLQGQLPWPRIGMLHPDPESLSMLLRLARDRREWQIITVDNSPAMLCATDEIPANFHQLGVQLECLWPALLAGWTAAITRGPALHRICLATGLPIIPLRDEVKLQELIAACERGLAESSSCTDRRQRAYSARRLGLAAGMDCAGASPARSSAIGAPEPALIRLPNPSAVGQ